MYDYSSLPTLVPVMNNLLGYLTVKERVRCKGVCRAWKEEIERREAKNDTLVLHDVPYPWNSRWRQTNNRGLMKYENSFEMKSLTFLKHPLTKALLAKTKKLAILNLCKSNLSNDIPGLQPYLEYFKNCEEIEIKNYLLRGTLTFDLPKLRVLVIESQALSKLVLNCPSLEVLFWDSPIQEIDFQNAKKLKRLFCLGWPESVSLDGKFESLVYINLYVNDELVDDSLLERMPKLKRLVLYSSNPREHLENLREQKKRFGLTDLEILPSAFRDPVEIQVNKSLVGYMKLNEDRCIDQLFENYSKLVEDSPWRVWIDYSKLFGKFRILPDNFIERFREPYSIDIREVTSYTHLFEFLKCYPSIHQLCLSFSKVDANRVLDLVHLLQPSLNELAIWEECASDVLKIDLSFMRLFKLIILHLESTRLPGEFLKQVAAKRGPDFTSVVFQEITGSHRMMIAFYPWGLLLTDISCGWNNYQFFSVDHLISGMQSDPHLSAFLL